MRTAIKFLVTAGLVIFLTACGNSEPKVEGRWYTQTQVDQGKQLFLANCAQCHGAAAQGTADWQTVQADGNYPPPPLNGTAHTWHHKLKGLKTTLKTGGAPYGGTMPGFADKLSDDQQDAVISFFQSKWNDKIYQAWIGRGGLK
ncbi:MAG: cytochrome c [Amphritea sp.]